MQSKKNKNSTNSDKKVKSEKKKVHIVEILENVDKKLNTEA